MRERFIGVGLGVGVALTLGIAWTDSAHAFSLGSEVTVENFLRNTITNKEVGFQGPTVERVVDGQEPRLVQFGGIWDINLGNNSITFTLNSAFENVISGDDVYSFTSSALDSTNQLPTITILSFTEFSAKNRPFARLTSRDELEVVFPLGFAPGGLLTPTEVSRPTFSTDLTVKPYAVPTPALLPGLVSMGLAVLRKRREDKNWVD